jgi:hypothetical protein
MAASRGLVAAAIAVLATGCGSPPEGTPASGPAPAPGEASAMDVFVLDATVVGELDGFLDVEAHPPGTLVPGEVLQPLFTFTATGQEVSIADSAYFAGALAADEGGGMLGVSGVCGRGWRRDGTRVADDPCAAATPVTSVEPGFPITGPFGLYPRVDDGAAAAGHYQVDIPLSTELDAPAGALRVHFELAPGDPARLPVWPEASVPLRVSLEEAPAVFFGEDPPPLTIRIEDPYRRALVERSLEEILAESSEPPSFEVPVPAGAWGVVTLVAGADGRLVRCGAQQALLEDGRPEVLTLVLDSVEVDGTCPRASA